MQFTSTECDLSGTLVEATGKVAVVGGGTHTKVSHVEEDGGGGG
jgi:hypothetical protein